AAAGIDLCCGTGNYTIPFIKHFDHLCGLDFSPDMLSFARNKSEQIQWIEADAKDTGCRDESYDYAWMISGLHYFKGEQQRMLFREVYRILKPGGVFVADTEFAEQHPSLWIVEYFPTLRERYRNALFSQEKYRAWLRSVGFSSVEFQTAEY